MLAAGEGVEPPSSSSKPDVLPVTPSRKGGRGDAEKGRRGEEVLISVSPCLPVSPIPKILVVVAGIEPTSLDYQSSALAVELHRKIG